MASSSGPKATRQLDGSVFAASAAGPAGLSSRAPPKVTPVPIPKPGSQPSVTQGNSQATTTTPNLAATDDGASLAISNGDVAQIAHLVPNDALPVIQDGRIRSPMPGKLKGKLDMKKGMFGVMLMSGPTTNDKNKRDAEAKRASESTQQAAQRALASGKGSIRKQKFVQLPPDLVPAPASSAPPPPPAPAPIVAQAPASSLSDVQIKAEQARLLTLLRSLNPIRVVDQICTALAFFGGIPGAPPPSNGAFPPSEMANGSGRLFVSWIAEIFPPVPGYGSGLQQLPPPPLDAHPAPVVPEPEPEAPVSAVRKRGRPKGSKSTRPRKDKGIKKGPLWARPDPLPKPKSGRPVGRPKKVQPPEGPGAGSAADESWVDVDQEDENEAGIVDTDQTPAPNTAPTKSPAMSPPTRTALPAVSQGSDGSLTSKRRGRPKGSKTRPKVTALPVDAGSVPEGTQPPQNTQAQFAPMLQSTSPSNPQASANSASFTPVNSMSVAQTAAQPAAQTEAQHVAAQIKNKTGRSQMSKSKPKSDQASSRGRSNPQTVTGPATAGTTAPLSAGLTGSFQQSSPAQGQISGFEPNQVSQNQPNPAASNSTHTGYFQAVSEPQILDSQNTISSSQATNSNPTVQTPLTGQKRKRKSNKSLVQDGASVLDNTNQATTQQVLESTGLTLPSDHRTSYDQQSRPLGQSNKASEASVASPPVKRQRKGKAAKPDGRSGAKAGATVHMDSAAPTSGVDAPSSSVTAPESFQTPFETAVEAAPPDPLSLDVDHAISSLQSSHGSQYDVQSSTMENYQAQLQAQLGQESDPDPSPVMQQTAPQNRVDPRQLMANQLQKQQQQQQQQKQQRFQQFLQRQQHQRQDQTQQSHQQQSVQPTSQSSSSHASSPRLQQQTAESQQENPRSSHPTARASQNNYGQYRPSSSPYGQQQSHSPRQSTQQQFSIQHQSSQVNPQTGQAQHYTPATQQQQYPSGQSQYTGSSQQQASALSRYPQQLVSAAGTSSYTTAQSPQFTAVNNSFSGSTTGLNITSQYNSLQRSLTGSSASTGYRTGSAQSMQQGQHRSPSSFGSTPSSQSQHQRPVSSTTSSMQPTTPQNLQNPALQSFATANNAAPDWSLFDTSNTAHNQNHNPDNLNMASYGMGGAGGTSGFGTGNDKFYTVGRR